jgi:hypothetical protein
VEKDCSVERRERERERELLFMQTYLTPNILKMVKMVQVQRLMSVTPAA